MMNHISISAVLFIVFAVIYFLFKAAQKRYFLNLQKKMMDTKNPSFEKLIKKRMTVLLIPPYTIQMMLLTRAKLTSNHKEEERILAEFDRYKMNPAQAVEVWLRGFNYYFAKKNNHECKKYKDRIDSLKGYDAIKKYVDLTYDIVFLGKDTYLDELLKACEEAGSDQKSGYEYLISVMYANRNDKKNSEKYNELSRMHMSQERQQLFGL